MTKTEKHAPRLDYKVAKTLIHIDLLEGPDNAPFVTPLGSVTKDRLDCIERLSALITAAPETAAERDRLREDKAELLEAARGLAVSLDAMMGRAAEGHTIHKLTDDLAKLRAAIAKAQEVRP